MNIYKVNKSTYDDEVGLSWYYSTREKALLRFEHYRNLYKDDETYESYDEDEFSVDGISVSLCEIVLDIGLT
jgi:hypothetical protein